MPSSDQSELERKLLRYLLDHPDARDTLDGIAQWWLFEQDIREKKWNVESAIEKLVADGLLIAELRKDGRKVFGVNEVRREAIAFLLKEK